MKRIWTIIGVRDVPRSFEWYQSLLDQPPDRFCRWSERNVHSTRKRYLKR